MKPLPPPRSSLGIQPLEGAHWQKALEREGQPTPTGPCEPSREAGRGSAEEVNSARCRGRVQNSSTAVPTSLWLSQGALRRKDCQIWLSSDRHCRPEDTEACSDSLPLVTGWVIMTAKRPKGFGSYMGVLGSYMGVLVNAFKVPHPLPAPCELL